MVTGEEPAVARDRVFDGVAEDERTAAVELAGAEEMGDDAIEGDFAETEDDAETSEGGDFLIEVRGAGGDLRGEGFVAGGSAADDGGDPGIGDGEAVAAVRGAGLRGESGAVEERVEEIAGTVAGEGAAGAVGSVSAGGEADEEDAGGGIAEGGNGLAPVLGVAVHAALVLGDSDRMGAQARAEFARDDAGVEGVERGGRIGERNHGAIVEGDASAQTGLQWTGFERTVSHAGEKESMWMHKGMAAAMAGALALMMGCNSNKTQPAPAEQAAQPAPAATSAAPEIGGQPVVKLTRQATSNGEKPEFLSLTVLPGRGMNVFQITANLPGKGEIPVLWSTTLEALAAKMTGKAPDDAWGNASFSCCGAFLVPYPNRIIGKLSPDEQTLTTEWHGKQIVLPANWHDSTNPDKDKHAMHGLILDMPAQDVQTVKIPDGESVTAVMHAGDFGGDSSGPNRVHWLSKTDLSFVISLTGKAVDATIVAKNVGNEEEPMAIGWHPYFSIPSGQHEQALLHVPGEQVAEVNNYQDVFPTGKLVPVKGTKWDFLAREGKPLDNTYLDDNWSKLQRTSGAVEVTLTDPASNYGVKVLGLSPDIRTVQVYSPPGKPFAAIEEQFNFADPFGKEWHGMNTGMVTLKPGESVEWHVRLELFQPNEESAAK